jgi:hypothetical protein
MCFFGVLTERSSVIANAIKYIQANLFLDEVAKLLHPN